MFDIGIQELVVVFLVALLVFGPKRLPELGRTLGRFVLEIRKGFNDARSRMESEFSEIKDQSGSQTARREEEPHRHHTAVSGAEDAGDKGEKA